jgi:DNA-binding IclR family transcriptional regulator
MRTLEGERLVARDSMSGKYVLGREILVLASAVVAHDPLLREGQVALRALRDEIGHTCSLASLDRESIVFLLVERAHVRSGAVDPPGRPASGLDHRGGKVPLMDDRMRRCCAWCENTGSPTYAITSRDVFLREIRRARRDGLALTEEATVGLLAVATCALRQPRWLRSASRARRTS